MNDFNQEYYFVSKPGGRNETLYLTPNEETTVRDYRFARQDPFAPPLVFFNRGKEHKAKQGIQSVRAPPQILFNGSNMLVPERTGHSQLGFSENAESPEYLDRHGHLQFPSDGNRPASVVVD